MEWIGEMEVERVTLVSTVCVIRGSFSTSGRMQIG